MDHPTPKEEQPAQQDDASEGADSPPHRSEASEQNDCGSDNHEFPPEPVVPPAPPKIPSVVDVFDLDWAAIETATKAPSLVERLPALVEGMAALSERAEGTDLLFDGDRADPDSRVVKISTVSTPLWFIGDLHGDLLALEAAVACIERESFGSDHRPCIVFLGDLFDDEGFGLLVLLRVYELILAAPDRVCLLAGNHDEALGFAGGRFTSTVQPSDFADLLNTLCSDDRVCRAGQLAVKLFAGAPRALFFPDGLLAAHGGFPLADLHQHLAETGDWNDPQALEDFVWARAHPKARKKLPNRYTKGSQFGYEDFAAFCALSDRLGWPITHMVRGHDHVEERYAVYSADRANPILTTVALSRRLDRESFGPFERVPTIARYVEGAVPQVYRLHIPSDLIREIYLEDEASEPSLDVREEGNS